VDLKERLDNLNKELEIVKQSQNQGATYKQPVKEVKNLEEIVADVENRPNKKGKKKESCQCACHIY
jgi:hypothetical protein